MRIKLNHLFQLRINILSSLILILCLSCSNSDDTTTLVETPSVETPQLTNLPFGGPNILIRNQGDGQPELLSLWLCGLPSDGAGNDDAGDWTDPDGVWD